MVVDDPLAVLERTTSSQCTAVEESSLDRRDRRPDVELDATSQRREADPGPGVVEGVRLDRPLAPPARPWPGPAPGATGGGPGRRPRASTRRPSGSRSARPGRRPSPGAAWSWRSAAGPTDEATTTAKGCRSSIARCSNVGRLAARPAGEALGVGRVDRRAGPGVGSQPGTVAAGRGAGSCRRRASGAGGCVGPRSISDAAWGQRAKTWGMPLTTSGSWKMSSPPAGPGGVRPPGLGIEEDAAADQGVPVLGRGRSRGEHAGRRPRRGRPRPRASGGTTGRPRRAGRPSASASAPASRPPSRLQRSDRRSGAIHGGGVQ